MQFNIEQFKGPCTCGHTHAITVKGIWNEAGALNRLPDLAAENNWKHPAVISDENTWEAAGKQAAALLPGSIPVILNPENLHANEHGVEAAKKLLPEADVLIAAGAGTIHDITRYLAHERGVPFAAVPTAASVDGFLSTVAAMTWHGCKKTMPAVAPLYVVADSDIYAKAPARLTASGFSDLLGKYTALTDWRVAHIITGEYLCERVCDMEMQALSRVCNRLDSIRRGERTGCEELMYGLLLSGLAMQMVGNSRPASGAEHHMSHLWEMEVLNPCLDAYHGEKVGVGLLLTARCYHGFGAALYDDGKSRIRKYDGLDKTLLERFFNRPGMLEPIMEENTPDPLEGVDASLFLERKAEIRAVLDALPSEETLRSYLHRAGARETLTQLGLKEDIAGPTVELSPYVRSRLTLMRLLKLFELAEL